MIKFVGFAVVIFGTVSKAENTTCSSTCSPSLENTTQTCSITSGECLYGCEDGYAGLNCSFNCPSNCMFPSENRTETCNDTTGECMHGCNHGFAGQNCSVECPKNCAASDKSGEDICNATSDECLFGCTDGFYGPDCTTLCNGTDRFCETCVSKEDNSAIICTKCKRNFYQGFNKCSKCGYFCEIKTHEASPLCRENDGYCAFGCREGYYQDKCDQRCKSLCDGPCHRKTGACLNGCTNVGYCGPTCELRCEAGCVSQHCNQSCDCVKGCKPDRWGGKCEKFCNINCIKPTNSAIAICDRSSGTCLHGCNGNNYWGDHCEDTCSDGCVNRICQQNSGNCTEACASESIYGLRCDITCSKNCLNGTCERSDGYCDKGCAIGVYGERCVRTCNKNCINKTCERGNGYCDSGCLVGSYGDQCDLVCNDNCLNNKCERTEGNCTDGCKSGYLGSNCEDVDGKDIIYYNKKEENSTLVGLALSGWLLFLMLLVLFTVLLTKQRYQLWKCKGNKSTDMVNDEQPSISEHQEYMTLQREQGTTNAVANYETLKPEEERTRCQRDYVNLEMNRL